MAFTPLPTDYTDAAWSGLKKYNQIDNPDGTVSFQDLTIYTQKEKSFFGAKDANQINRAINDTIRKMEQGTELLKVGNLSTTTSPVSTDLLPIEQGSVLKKISYGNLTKPLDDKIAPLMYNNAGSHNAVYRGKYLGSSVTTKQYAAISSGQFTDLYIGDYWTIGGINYRIAAFDYYLNTGDVSCSTHHAVIVPDTILYTVKMNAGSTTVGGYVGSDMYKTGLTPALSTIKSAFRGHVLKHRVLLVNAVSNGKPSNGAFCDEEINLMNEEMVYGCGITKPSNDDVSFSYNSRIEKTQLPLFFLNPSMIVLRAGGYWLRDVWSSSGFATVSRYGNADYSYSSSTYGVRPAFCIS